MYIRVSLSCVCVCVRVYAILDWRISVFAVWTKLSNMEAEGKDVSRGEMRLLRRHMRQSEHIVRERYASHTCELSCGAGAVYRRWHGDGCSLEVSEMQGSSCRRTDVSQPGPHPAPSSRRSTGYLCEAESSVNTEGALAFVSSSTTNRTTYAVPGPQHQFAIVTFADSARWILSFTHNMHDVLQALGSLQASLRA
jgi:hypothetical protein